MTNDLAEVGAIARIAAGKTVGSELAFTFPEVLEAIRLCTKNELAVLGVEVFEVRPGGYLTKNFSDYDHHVGSEPKSRQGWLKYVEANNCLAEEFAKQNPTGNDHVYVLTTASWREIQALKRR